MQVNDCELDFFGTNMPFIRVLLQDKISHELIDQGLREESTAKAFFHFFKLG